MKKLSLISLLFLLFATVAKAQLGSFGDAPVEINSDQTSMENGLAVARDNVVIHYGASTIYCNYAQYDPDTREVLVKGNVRIYNEGHVFIGERAVYNLDTKALRTADFKGDFYPFDFSADTFSSIGPNAFQAQGAIMTTSDSSKPDYYLKAKSIRIYMKDRVVFSNVTLYLGKTPVFWYPYLYQSLERDTGFLIRPGYDSIWGGYVLTQYSFPVSDTISGKLHLDLRTLRGVAFGLDFNYKSGKNDQNWARFTSYYAYDTHPETNDTAYRRGIVDPNRYRISLQGKYYFTDDIYGIANINKLSDSLFLQDFYPRVFQIDPQPDNVIALTKWDENYAANVIVRAQVNDFFETTERLPEFSFDLKRQQLFSTPIFVEGEASAGHLDRAFPDGYPFSSYSTNRVDAFVQFLYPKTYFGWLNFTPRVAFRGTYYSSTGDSTNTIFDVNNGVEALVSNPALAVSTNTPIPITKGGAIFRPVIGAGFESSFKISKAFEDVQTRKWGFDGLRHVIQPYTDFSFVYTGQNPNEILQFDRINPSTQLPPLDLSAFNSIDAITNWTIWRWGVRNRLETRRDNETITWLSLDSYFDINLDDPHYPGINYQQGSFSNFFNNLKWNPLPWLGAQVDSQLPLNNQGFTQVNTMINFQVTSNWKFDVGHRYIQGNPYFDDSSLIEFGTYFRINDNWGLSLREQYEMKDHTLQYQTYQIHRDLSSWTAALGFVVRDNRVNNQGSIDYGVLLTFTLKDFPQISSPISFDPGNVSGQGK